MEQYFLKNEVKLLKLYEDGLLQEFEVELQKIMEASKKTRVYPSLEKLKTLSLSLDTLINIYSYEIESLICRGNFEKALSLSSTLYFKIIKKEEFVFSKKKWRYFYDFKNIFYKKSIFCELFYQFSYLNYITFTAMDLDLSISSEKAMGALMNLVVCHSKCAAFPFLINNFLLRVPHEELKENFYNAYPYIQKPRYKDSLYVLIKNKSIEIHEKKDITLIKGLN